MGAVALSVVSNADLGSAAGGASAIEFATFLADAHGEDLG
jgi:hypothetical protein